MSSRFFSALILLLLALLTGCGAVSPPREWQTNSDQTDGQKRAQIRLQLAMGYYEQRQLTVALDEIKLALAANPDLSDAYNVRGLIYLELGEYPLADENFQRALRLAPNDPDLANNYGWFLCRSGKPALAMPYFESAWKNRSYQSPAKALNNAGVCSLKLRDVATAERYFLQAFQLEPGNPNTNMHLAGVMYQRGDYMQARFYSARAIKAELLTAQSMWLALKIEHKLGDKLAEASMAAQLKRRHPNSSEYAAYQRGAFDE